MYRATTLSSLALCVILFASATAVAELSVVVPNDLVDFEGNASTPPDFGGTPFRLQFLYEADQFGALTEPSDIIGLVLRPDESLTSPQEVIYDDLKISLSTTDREFEDLDFVFEENIGLDEKVVLDGEVLVATEATGPEFGPRDFDYRYDFTTPFTYDPSQGNLLMDVVSFSGQDIAALDDQDSTMIAVYTADPLGEEGEILGAGLVAMFLFDEGGIAGDFDGNGVLEANDIDLLSAEVRGGNNPPSFDLNGDNLVNSGDRNVWVNELKKTYFGDADLNGEFNSGDFVAVFQAGEYEDGVAGNSSWSTGDWDGNADFDSGDFVVAFQAGGFEQGPRAAVPAVPEPASWVLLSIALLMAVHRRRR